MAAVSDAMLLTPVLATYIGQDSIFYAQGRAVLKRSPIRRIVHSTCFLYPGEVSRCEDSLSAVCWIVSYNGVFDAE